MLSDLKPGKHLLLDNFCLNDAYRLFRTVHRPRRDPAEPVLAVTEPWEGTAVLQGAAAIDPTDGLWKQWYIAYDEELHAERKRLGKSKNGNVGEPQPFRMCFATSRDGVRWEKPRLGIHGDTNICFKGFSGIDSASVLFRPEAQGERRFTLAHSEWRSMETGGVYVASSADGVHWSHPPGDKPAIHGDSDCINSLAWNAERGVYMLYMRAWHSAALGWVKEWVAGSGVSMGNRTKNTRRRIGYAESADLVNWSEPQVILYPDELDTNDLYGMGVFRYADAYLGQLWLYDDDAAGTIEVELIWSRDGVTWSRHPKRPKFMAAGEKGDLDGYMALPTHAPVVAGDGIYFFVCARGGVPHDAGLSQGKVATLAKSAIYRVKLRTDGFVSLDADRRLGALITRPFTLASDAITINAATQGGRIVAELVEPYAREPEGKPIEGFGKADSDGFEGDAVSHRLTWRGRGDLSALRGKRVMLKMSMYHAQLYSFTI